MRKSFIRFLWGALLIGIVALVVGFTAIWNGWVGYMPNVDDLQNPISKYASQIFSADGKVILHRPDNSSDVYRTTDNGKTWSKVVDATTGRTGYVANAYVTR